MKLSNYQLCALEDIAAADMLDDDQFKNIEAMVESAGYCPGEQSAISIAANLLDAYVRLSRDCDADDVNIPWVQRIAGELRALADLPTTLKAAPEAVPVDEAKERVRFEAHMANDGWLPSRMGDAT